jgi:PAS domain S-box-containing protein
MEDRLKLLEPHQPMATPKILVVDDDKFQIELIRRILNKSNYDVIGFTNSSDALKETGAINPDLILLDLVMPDIDGFELCRRLKADGKTRHIPIIILTSRDSQETESKVFELGAVDYITKPYDPVIVNARIRNQLELKQHRDALELLVQKRTAERDKSQQQFQDLVEKSLVGIAIVQNDRVMYQNPEWTRNAEDLSEMIIRKDFSFIHPDDKQQLLKAYRELLTQKSANVEIDIRIVPPGKAVIRTDVKWVKCRASLFRYQGQDALLINLVDITHTKELERLLLVRNKMASLGRVASGMAHEIRNPLTGITSYLYTLEQLCEQKTLLPKDVDLMNEIIGQLKLASHKVDAVIKRVLDFAKPTAPRMVSIDINHAVNNVMGLTSVTMRKAGISITADLEENLPRCYGDMTLIEQVILNLIQNAWRAVRTVEGNKHISVTSYSQTRQICITVSDTGPGVPAELKEKIFDPFFTTSSDGSGIGLSIAQRIVTDHNGSIALQDSPSDGAFFLVTLPIEKRNLKR